MREQVKKLSMRAPILKLVLELLKCGMDQTGLALTGLASRFNLCVVLPENCLSIRARAKAVRVGCLLMVRARLLPAPRHIYT